MLRITRREEPAQREVLRLDGSLAGAWVEEMRRACRPADGRAVLVDLGGVSWIDQDGLDLIAALRRDGVSFTNCSGFVAELLKGVAPC